MIKRWNNEGLSPEIIWKSKSLVLYNYYNNLNIGIGEIDILIVYSIGINKPEQEDWLLNQSGWAVNHLSKDYASVVKQNKEE